MRAKAAMRCGRAVPSFFLSAFLLLASSLLSAQTPANVLVVVNDNSPVSRSIGEYYSLRRSIPLRNMCHVRTSPDEEIARSQYLAEIATPIANCLKKNSLVESV